MSARPPALAVYRTLLRARATAFRGDDHALAAATREIRSKARGVCSHPRTRGGVVRAASVTSRGSRVDASDTRHTQFEVERDEKDEARLKELLQDGRDAARFLIELVVQGGVTEEGNLAVAFKPEHAGMEAELPSADKKT